MKLTKVYQRDGDTDAIMVLAYLGGDQGDDEIRIVQRVHGETVVDDIAYHGRDGSRWLDERHADWTQDGYTLISTHPGYLEVS